MENLTGVDMTLFSPEDWRAAPDIYMGALNAFLGAEQMVQKALSNPNSAPLWEMVLGYGFNATWRLTPQKLQNFLDPREGSGHCCADVQPLSKNTPGSHITSMVLSHGTQRATKLAPIDVMIQDLL